ncbi:MAG: thiamine pyrophosphate-binding protein [Proteobacteria bacterium]|nr:thiamine pyrophosphate-binding protein [Pseudomonadota bacterium]
MAKDGTQAGLLPVADRIAATLAAYGVRHAFGIPGNDVLEVIRACEAHGIAYVLAKSEPGAAFMADAVYQLTGRPAVLIAALGPGLANAMAGIAGALMERSAMLVLSGEAVTKQAGIYTHQVFDHVALARPLVKYASPLNPERAQQQVAKALDIALAYPAGPVMLNLAADHARAESREALGPSPAEVLATGLNEAGAASLHLKLAAAARPLALVGRGALAMGVPAALSALIEAWQIPYFTTYKAKGVLPEEHRLALGSVGLSPVVDAEAIRLLGDSDLLLLVGFDPIELRDAWLDAWGPDKPVISVDWGRLEHRVYPVGEQALGHVPTILGQLTPDRGAAQPRQWQESRLAGYKASLAQIVRARTPEHGISPAALFHAVSRQARPEWIMSVDVGAHRILANHVILCRSPGQLLQSNGFGCMGYALPAAIGAGLAQPGRPVVALIGDGCMLMSLGELALAAELGQNLVVVVLNDAALSLIKLKQKKMQLAPLGVDFRSPDFAAIARGFGAKGIRVERIEDFEGALAASLKAGGITVIDAAIDPSEYLEQM